ANIQTFTISPRHVEAERSELLPPSQQGKKLAEEDRRGPSSARFNPCRGAGPQQQCGSAIDGGPTVDDETLSVYSENALAVHF
ncbi:hypothetical protein JOQ06_007320, partial [Pogonophryne albipinna]